MAIVYFTNSYDDGNGSLRNAIASASAGDVVTPDPNVDWGGTEIEIKLVSTLPSRTETIDGGDYRIVLNGQGTVRFLNETTDVAETFRNVDFKNGYKSDTGVIYVTALGASSTLTFENCKFYGGSGSYSGAVHLANANTKGTVVFRNCVAYNNVGTRSGTYPSFLFVASVVTATVNVIGCTVAKDETNDKPAFGGTGGTVTKTNCLVEGENDVDFATAGFVDAANGDFRLLPTSPYLTGGATTGTDILGHDRSGSLGAYEGSWFVGGSVASNLAVDYAEGSATLADGVFLAVRKGSTVASASSTGTAYFSAPSRNGATLSGVRFATYGGALTAIGASVVGRSALASITSTGLVDCVEFREFGTSNYSALAGVTSAAGTFQTPSDKGFYIRAFDGVNFVESAFVPRTYYLKDVSTGGSFATASDWAMDANRELTCDAAPTIKGGTFVCK